MPWYTTADARRDAERQALTAPQPQGDGFTAADMMDARAEERSRLSGSQVPGGGEVLRELIGDIRHSANVDDYKPAQIAFLESIADRLTILSNPQARPDGWEIKWPERLINLPCPDGTGDRILGFRIPDGDPILGEHGLSEPLAWLRSVTVERHPAPAPDVARLVLLARRHEGHDPQLREALAPFIAAQQERNNHE